VPQKNLIKQKNDIKTIKTKKQTITMNNVGGPEGPRQKMSPSLSLSMALMA
jgi:hypothetical protein